MFGYPRGLVAIQSGKSNGRSIHDLLWAGKIKISGIDGKGRSFERYAAEGIKCLKNFFRRY
jgi:hypothetical protein